MQVRCTRNCKNKDEQGRCLAKEISIEETGCGAFIRFPEFEPFRADNVVIYDKVGIPSVMVRFSRVTDNDLFGGSCKPHPAFVIDGKVHDEIYISKYPNTVINGRAYSLPMTEPETCATCEEAVNFCKAKGEGWHLWTAAERGLIANICHKNEVFPHGNTYYGYWHGDKSEKGEPYGNGCANMLIGSGPVNTLTGSGPATWNHDHTPFGVSDLCGNAFEWVAGMRLMDGVIEVIPDNNAAADIDMSKDSDRWVALMKDDKPIRISVKNSGLKFTTERSRLGREGCPWENVEFEFDITEQMKELALYPGEPKTFLHANTEGERFPIVGSCFATTAWAGMFNLSFFADTRSGLSANTGFRSAFYGKLNSEV